MTANTPNRLYYVIVGGAIGALLGVPISYLFQPGIMRAFMSLGDYITKFGEVWSNRDAGVGNTARISILGCAIVGVVIGGAICSMRAKAAKANAPASPPAP